MIDLTKKDLNYLKNLQSVEGDLEIARRVVCNDKIAIHYFLGSFSIPFLNYIGREIMKLEGCYVNGILCYYPDISADYYTFIGAEFIKPIDKFVYKYFEKSYVNLSMNNSTEDEYIPTWYKVALYKGVKNKGVKEARLYTYINTITVRHFINLKKKLDKKNEKNIDDMLESESVSILIDHNGFDELILSEENPKYEELREAWDSLKERDRLILKYLVIENRKPLEIFDEMIQYVRTNIPIEQYTRKQKQDVISLMKSQAKRHLRELILRRRVK
ncbi:MAG: hypothetical protein IKJ31_08085 [Bacteroidaceae bacterium]|nr:hypothetical protein [Bacteroidaceae bacterium]